MSAIEIEGAQYAALMERRAAQFARTAEARQEGERLGTYAIVAIGAESLGIPMASMREIVKAPVLTPLPGAPPYMPGVVQIRGTLLGAVDLAALFGLATAGERALMAIVEGAPGAVGLFVDGVEGFRDISGDELTLTLGESGESKRPIKGTTKDMLALLDVARLLEDPRLVVERG